MENRSHALLAGAFTVIFVIVSIVVALWIGRDRSAVVFYDIISTKSVNGLSEQSTVRYQGVPVGRVQNLYLYPDKPGQVRIRIGVTETTPITTSTWAELGVQGVTGQANIELHDSGNSLQRLQTTPERVAVIPLKAGFLERLEERGSTILDGLEKVTSQVERGLSDKNVESFSTILAQTSSLTSNLNTMGTNIAPAVERMGRLADSVSRAADQVSALLRSAQGLFASGGAIDAANKGLSEVAKAIVQVSNETLPALRDMAESLSNAGRGAANTVRRLGESPQSILFGPPPAEAGPGEPGFVGFGSQKK